MSGCLDTDVLVDCLRGLPAAKAWMLANRGAEEFVVPGIAAMELVAGCRNQAELERLRAYLVTLNVT